MLNDVFLNGKEQDLSSLGLDITSFKNIRINVVKKQLKIFVNDYESFSEKYNESIGKLVGIRYKFLGAGEIKHLRITDNNKNIIAEDNFPFNKK